MENDSLKGRTHDAWERGFRSGLAAARKIYDHAQEIMGDDR
jgi:hypothetical protein